MSRAEVLVVGAGPVGLVLACELLSRDVAVRLVDMAPDKPTHSRAAIIWPRILEQLRRISVTGTLVEAGHRVDAVAFYSDRRPLGEVSMAELGGTPYPYGLTIPQDRTERILTQRLHALGGRIERGVTLESLGQDAESVHGVLRHADSSTEEFVTGWLVGADGAHSTVRKLLGVPFDGDAPEITFAVADAAVSGGHSVRKMHYFYSRAGAFGLAPLDDRTFRMAISIPPRQPGDGPPSRELFQQMLTARGSGEVHDLEWSSAFTLRCRTASQFRAGRCFLAGDAAHIMSPAGGQGMNTGILDAVDLGWKLGGTIRGAFRPDILDTYDADRRRAALRVTATTTLQTRWGLLSRPAQIAVRDTAYRLAHRTGVVQRVAAPVLSQLSVGYGRGPSVRELVTHRPPGPGDRVPAFVPDDAAVRTGPWPALARDDLTVLLWRGRAKRSSWAARTRVIRATAPPGVPVVDVANDPASVADFGPAPLALLVRPDGHVVRRLPIDDPLGLHGALAPWHRRHR
ncbi:FAD-dependent monooxygenase [Krasilnikovia sp. M28-CT-15]|uniref:FAD-dependent monooxygenase n=1 Tax=Krasilnikovia sp. M28-CT-15 TaxID=3373540 RepID=UPI003875D938